MSENKATVQEYMRAFSASAHTAVLARLTDDIVWRMPGAFDLRGKAAFDGEIENPEFESKPAITVTRLVEEGDVVVAEGRVRTLKKTGEVLHVVFCDVFVLRDARIRELTSYVMMLPSGATD
jgi:uncharacterized protein